MHSEKMLIASAGDVQYEFDTLAIGAARLEAGIEDHDIANLVSEGTLVHGRSLLVFFLPTSTARATETEILAEHYAPTWTARTARSTFSTRSSGLDIREARNQLNVRMMHLSTERSSLQRIDTARLFAGVLAMQARFVSEVGRSWRDVFHVPGA